MSEESKKTKRGGARPGCGRKKGGHNVRKPEEMTPQGAKKRKKTTKRVKLKKEIEEEIVRRELIVHDAIGTPMAKSENHKISDYAQSIRKTFDERFAMGVVVDVPPDIKNDEEASDKWKELMNAYSDQNDNIITTLDLSSLKLFCMSWGRYWRAYKEWQLNDKRVASIDKDENMELRQIIAVMQKEQQYMATIMSDLLLTPAGRAKAGLLVAKVAEAKMNRDEESAYATLSAFAQGE